jgi:transcriptional regulator with XRE-family HTH domain
MKTAERDMARKFRRDGLSVREIERRLGVSRSSVSLWVRDIELSVEQRAALAARNGRHPRQLAGARRRSARYRAIRAGYQEEGRVLARRGDPLFAAGCMLYWAEGGKRRTTALLTNSDPEVLRYFVTFLRRYFGVADDELSVYCNLFADHLPRQRQVEQFWLDTLELPRSCLRKSQVNVYSKYSQKKRRNKLPYGTCRVVVHRSRVVQAIYGAIQEYAGFERPEWLD